MTNQTTRVLELLKKFNNNEKVCINQLQNEYLWDGKSEKTIRRDLDVLKSIFPESFELIPGGDGCYKAITKDAFDNFMKPDVLSLMVQTFNMARRSDLFDNFGLDEYDQKIITKKIKELDKIYIFKNKPFESKANDHNILKVLERSIKYQKCILVKYNNSVKEVKPYNILFINENFYLACEVDDIYEFSMYRISKIETIENTSKTFHKKHDIEQFIKNIQTPFPKYTTNYKEHLVEVILEVGQSKAYYFKSKEYLSSQKILEEKDDGTLIVQYKVTQEMELEDLVKRWLPHVKVQSPVSLKEKIEKELKEYLK